MLDDIGLRGPVGLEFICKQGNRYDSQKLVHKRQLCPSLLYHQLQYK
jgi:hypothetical protein